MAEERSCTLLVCVIVCCVITDIHCNQVCSSLNAFSNLKEDKAITGSIFRKLTGYGIVGCAKQCLLRSACQSFNYELITATCQLNRNSSTATVQPGGEVVTAVGTVSSDKSTWPTRVAGICGGKTCPDNSVCVEQSDGSTSCKVECPDPILSNGNIVGPVSLDVGSVLTHRCNDGFAKGPDARCLNTGEWSAFSCDQACVTPPTIMNAVLTSIGSSWVVGTILNYTCNVPYIPFGTVTCLSTGSWSQMFCVPPVRTCTDLQACNSTYTDGEYWLFPAIFDDKPVKIFCHKMGSGTPQHFLTLPEENYVDYSDIGCDPVVGTRALYEKCKTTRFNKLRISDFANMRTDNVGLKDYTYINTFDPCYYLQFGNVHDCHAYPDCQRSRSRNYVINTRGTGLILSPNQEWNAQVLETTLLPPITIIKEDLDRKITVKCHQPCKWCYPVGDTYTFVIDASLPAAASSATIPSCTFAFIRTNMPPA